MKAEVKTLLKITKANAGTDIYFRLKNELLDLFGKKPEDDFTRAKNRRLTGKPSQLGKLLIEDICKKEKKLQGCCCANTVWAMFRDELPVVIRNHISEMTFSHSTYKSIFAKADQVWASNQAPEPHPRPTVAAVTSEQAGQPESPEVAAIGRGRGSGRGQRRGGRQAGRGGGRGGTNPTPPPNASNTSATTSAKPKGTRHPTAKGKDESLCKIHFNWGVNATYCAAPWKCPMKDTWKAPQ